MFIKAFFKAFPWSWHAFILHSFFLSQVIHITHLVQPQPPFSDSSLKFKQRTKRYFRGEKRRKKYESKGKEMEFTVQMSGEFQCPLRHSRALFSLAGCVVKRAAATAGYIYSDKSLHMLKMPEQGLFV